MSGRPMTYTTLREIADLVDEGDEISVLLRRALHQGESLSDVLRNAATELEGRALELDAKQKRIDGLEAELDDEHTLRLSEQGGYVEALAAAERANEVERGHWSHAMALAGAVSPGGAYAVEMVPRVVDRLVKERDDLRQRLERANVHAAACDHGSTTALALAEQAAKERDEARAELEEVRAELERAREDLEQVRAEYRDDEEQGARREQILRRERDEAKDVGAMLTLEIDRLKSEIESLRRRLS